MAYTRPPAALGAAEVAPARPIRGRPQPPIYPPKISSGWHKVRSSPADGSCGTRPYPCVHPGIDLHGAAGTPVVAPEAGKVVAVGAGNAPPYTGYGPWFAILQGASGKFHMLAHLAPVSAPMAPLGRVVGAGDQLGTTSTANHVHWEVRARMVPGPGEDNFSNNQDPMAWLSAQDGVGTLIAMGGVVLLVLLTRRRS